MKLDPFLRSYGWPVGTVLALAGTNLLVTLALIFFDYGVAIEASEAGAIASRSPLLVALFYIFAPLIAVPTRMGWPLPGGSLVVIINAALWSLAVYFLILGIAGMVGDWSERAE
jgi:hypothetical protein